MMATSPRRENEAMAGPAEVKDMNLRTKLLLGYLVFVIALAALGAWSVWRLREMGGVTRQILSNNYDSVVAAQDMKESIERQDSAAVFALLGQRERALSQMREHRLLFDAAFDKAANNITEPGEREIIDAIRQDRDEYYRRFDAFLEAAAQSSAANASGLYFTRLEPLFHQLRGRCDDLLKLNQSAMAVKSDRAVNTARRGFLATGAIVATLVALGIALAFLFAEKIVRPVRELTAVTSKVAGGNLDAKAEIVSRDEVGLLAAEFNRMAERIKQLRRSDLGKLLVAQQTTEAAIDSLYDPVIVTDAKGRVTKLNPAAEEVFGKESENAGKPIADIARDTRIAAAAAEAIRSESAVVSEGASSLLPLAVDGKERAFRLRTTPMRDERGLLLGAVTLLEDITHLRELDRLKSEFIATASQELRAPLMNVQTGIHVLIEEAAGELNEKQLDVLYACRADCERLDKLMRDLLEMSKIESGERAPRLAPVNLTHMLRESAELLRPQIEAKGLEFKTEIPFDLPVVMADANQVERIITNLISNAVRHTARGGEIHLNAERRRNGAAISISDTGCGIPPKYLPRVFDKFSQAPNTISDGAGLGLAISKGLVEGHDGQISVQSELGRGTTFTFTLPSVPASIGTSGGASGGASGGTSGGTSGGASGGASGAAQQTR